MAKTRGTTTERGYDGTHQQIRAQLQPYVDAGQATCTEPRCLMVSRWIKPGTPWDLAHDRTNGGYLGPAHRTCNRSEGATYGNRLRRRTWRVW